VVVVGNRDVPAAGLVVVFVLGMDRVLVHDTQSAPGRQGHQAAESETRSQRRALARNRLRDYGPPRAAT
jgi:hypothetical protein